MKNLILNIKFSVTMILVMGLIIACGGDTTTSSEEPETITPPGAPTSLTEGTITSDSITVSWTAPANDGGATVTYDVYMSSNSQAEATGKTGATKVEVTTGTTYTATGLTASTTYYFAVFAKNSAGESVALTGSATTAAPAITPPSTPTGFVSSGITADTITVSWTLVDDGGAPVTYDVYMSTISLQDAMNKGGIKVEVTTGTTYTATGLTATLIHHFAIFAKNSVGESAPLSGTATTAVSLAIDFTVDTTSSSSVSVSWTAPTNVGGATVTYDVYRSSKSLAEATNKGGTKVENSITTTSHTSSSLTAGTTYYFAIFVKVNGLESRPLTGSATTAAPAITPPSTPTGFVSSGITADTITVSWTLVDDGGAPVTYDVYMSTISLQDAMNKGGIKVEVTTGTTYTATGLTATLIHHFAIFAKNSVGESAPLSGTATTAVSLAIDFTVDTTSSSSVSVSWTAPTNVGGATVTYDVYRSSKSLAEATNKGGTKVEVTTGTTYTATGLTASTTYYFAIFVKVNGLESRPLTGSATTAAPAITPPSTPTGFVSSGITADTITVSWTLVDDGGAPVTYDVYMSTISLQDAMNKGGIKVEVTTGTTYTATGLTATLTHHFAIFAKNSVGESAPLSGTATTAVSLAIDFTVDTTSSSSVSVSWTAPTNVGGATVTYDVYRSSKSLAEATNKGGTKVENSITTTSHTSSSLTAGTTYYFAIFVKVNGLESRPLTGSARTD